MSRYWTRDFDLAKNIWRLIDDLYLSLLRTKNVERLQKSDEPHILDQQFAIDVLLRQENDMMFTVQEKVRSFDYIDFDEFTLEFYSNHPKQIKGEYFKLCTDLYTYLYLTEDELRIAKGYIFWVSPVKLAILRRELKGTFQQNKEHSYASFFAYKFSDFKDEWFLWRKPNPVESQPPLSQFEKVK